jgi:hypothetical protein
VVVEELEPEAKQSACSKHMLRFSSPRRGIRAGGLIPLSSPVPHTRENHPAFEKQIARGSFEPIAPRDRENTNLRTPQRILLTGNV